MRQVVDEKLQTTLEKIGESFKLVKRLEAVHKGPVLAKPNDVGGLKKVLSNVSDEEQWGRFRLRRFSAEHNIVRMLKGHNRWQYG